MSLFEELKRRNVFRVGIAYAVVSWLLLQVIATVVPILDLPEWVAKLALLILALGFIPALIFAWAFELTPEGVKKESEVDRTQSILPQTGRKLDRIIIAFLVIALGYFAWDKFASKDVPAIPAGEAVVPAGEAVIPAGESVIPAGETVIPAQAGTHDEKSIAVLPFVNMSSDAEQEYFSDGLAEELLNRLAQNNSLRVAARTSAFQFKGQNLDVAEIGRQLKVDHVLEGSVRKAGNRLRITAQLINVADGFHLWSETYEREMDDIFAIQDDISGAISQALELELGTPGSTATLAPTSNLEAYNLYLRGRYLLAARGGKNMREAEQLFERAIALDPGFAAAWSALAFNASVLWGYTFEVPPAVLYEKAVRAAQRAIELDPGNAEAYTALGRAEGFLAKHWQAGLKALQHAYELAPNNAEVVNLYGDFLTMMGDFDQANQIERKAAMLDPLSATDATDVAYLLLMQNRPEEALKPARLAMELAPDSYYRTESMIYGLLQSGRFEEGKQLIEETTAKLEVERQDPATVALWWCMYYFQRNDASGLRKYLTERIANSHPVDTAAAPLSNMPSASFLAFYYLWLDGTDAALRWLQIARESGDYFLVWPEWFYLPERMSTDPAWLKFWDQPEYQELFEIRRSHPYDNISYWKVPDKGDGAN